MFLPQNNNGKFQMTYELIGNGTIAVPTHFFKVLLVPKSTDYALASFILPNQAIDSKTDLNSFSVDLTNIETASGLQFFEKLDRTKFLKLCDLVTCKV